MYAQNNPVSFRLNESEAADMLKIAVARNFSSVGALAKYLVQEKVKGLRDNSELNIAHFINDLSMPGKDFRNSKLEKDASFNLLRNFAELFKGEAFPNDELIGILKRDMSVGLAENYGSDLVGTNIDATKTVILEDNTLSELGIQITEQPDGKNLIIPSVTGSGLASFVPTEGAGVTETTPGTDTQMTLSPKLASVYFEKTRQFLLQAGKGAHDQIIKELSVSLNDLIINKLFNGDGTNNTPTGLENAADVQSVTGTSFTLDKAMQMVKASNVKSLNGSKWVMNINTFYKLAIRDIATSTGEMMIKRAANGQLYMANFPVVVSGGPADDKLYFGNFAANTVLCYFGPGLDILVQTAPITGMRKFELGLFLDLGFQNASSFVKTTIS